MIAQAWRLLADGSGSGRARRFLRVWAWYERLDMRFRPNLPIPGAPTHVFSVTFVHHRGRPIMLPDGTEVRRGDRLCQLHITNARLAAITSRGVWRAQTAMEGDLRALAGAFERAEFPDDVKAVFAIAVLARAAGRLGFTVRPAHRTPKAFFDRVYRQGLLALYCPDGAHRFTNRRTANSWSDELWMSSSELMRRYGQAY